MLRHFTGLVKYQNHSKSSFHSPIYETCLDGLHIPPWVQKQLSTSSAYLHPEDHSQDHISGDQFFRINVIEIDNNGNSLEKGLMLETIVNELRATEKSKLDKLLNEQSEDHEMYKWNNSHGRLERKSIKSKEYQRQRRSQLPLRDLRMFFRHIKLVQKHGEQFQHVHHQIGFKGTETNRLPSILPRASADCFLLELEHLRLLCKKDRCIVLKPSRRESQGAKDFKVKENHQIEYESIAEITAVNEFVQDLKRNLKSSSLPDLNAEVGTQDPDADVTGDEMKNKFDIRNYSSADQAFLGFMLAGKQNINTLPFELIVLETAFSSVISRLRRHQELMLPLLDVLIHETLSANPPTRIMLRRTLAFKQNLAKFESKIFSIRDLVRNLLSNDQDMADLCLSNEDSGPNGEQSNDSEHEEVELLLEAYAADLNHISSEANRMKIALDDTDDFVNTHLSTMRNKIIRMSLSMEMGMFSIAVSALLAGVGGMNMTHGFEEHPLAFYLTCGGMVACTSTFFSILYGRYRLLDSDTSEARMRHYYALKNYLSVLDEVEARLKIGGSPRVKNGPVDAHENSIIKNETNYVTKEQFGNVLKSVINAQQDEIDLIFKSFDADRSGILEMDELTDEKKSRKNAKKLGIFKSDDKKRGMFKGLN